MRSDWLAVNPGKITNDLRSVRVTGRAFGLCASPGEDHGRERDEDY